MSIPEKAARLAARTQRVESASADAADRAKRRGSYLRVVPPPNPPDRHMGPGSITSESVIVALNILRSGETFEHLLKVLNEAAKPPKAAISRESYSSEFHAAMAGLSKRGIDLALVGQALQTWHLFCAATTPPEPTVEQTADGGVRFAWNDGRLYLDAQVYADGSTEWFFKNFETGDTDGTDEERDTTFPARFFELLRLLRNRP